MRPSLTTTSLKRQPLLLFQPGHVSLSHFMFLWSIYCHLTCHLDDLLVLFIICLPPTRGQGFLSIFFTALSLCLDYDGTQEVLNKHPLSEHILLFPSRSSVALASLEPGQVLSEPGKTIQHYTAHSSCSISVHRIKPKSPPRKNTVSKPSSKIFPKRSRYKLTVICSFKTIF